jgi:alpha-glucosidase (family GH31 glycosyl hydrolase)
LLIAPVYEKGATRREVYLPKGDWYDWWTNTKETGGKTVSKQVDLSVMPIYVRAGSIIPLDPVRQYTSEVVNEPTTLKIFTGADGVFTLYEDDGISQEYLNGKGTWTKMLWSDKTRTLTLEPSPPKGSINIGTSKTFKVQILPEGTIKSLSYTGKAAKLRF